MSEHNEWCLQNLKKGGVEIFFFLTNHINIINHQSMNNAEVKLSSELNDYFLRMVELFIHPALEIDYLN